MEENLNIPSPKFFWKSRLELSKVGRVWHLKDAQFLSCDRIGAVAHNNHCEATNDTNSPKEVSFLENLSLCERWSRVKMVVTDYV